MEQIFLHLVSGAIGGNISASVMPKQQYTTLTLSAAGIVGGLFGGRALQMVAATEGQMLGLLPQIGSGLLGGAAFMALVSLFKRRAWN